MAEARILRISRVTLGLLVVTGVICAVAAGTSAALIALWATAIAAGQAVRIPTRSGGVLYFGIVPAVTVPLLFADPITVVSIYSLGLAGGSVAMRLRREDPARIRAFLLAEVVGFAAYGAVVVALTETFTAAGVRGDLSDLTSVVAGALAWFVIGSSARAWIGYEQEQLSVRFVWLRALADWPAVLALFATGALFGFAWPELRWWAIAVALMPYGFSHIAFVRESGTRRTYGQMIRALARIPEVAGLSSEGHAARSAGIAVAVGQDLGMTPHEVTELEYAALMHDIGRITLNEPAILKAGYTDEDIARWGAQIVAEAPYLREVARLIELQHHPYRQPGEQTDESLPASSKIIRVASAYDQAVHETGLPPLEALEVLHRGAAYDFDPVIVNALRAVLTRRGAISY